MLKLKPYKACDAETIISWIKNEYNFRQWSADRYKNYPISANDMNDYYNREKSKNQMWIMSAYDESGIVGHFTLRFPKKEIQEIRLGFVIVDDKKRRKGYGKELVQLAIQYAFDSIKGSKISLGVFENNMAAIRCYKSCGFQEVKLKNIESYKSMGEIWNCIEMERNSLV